LQFIVKNNNIKFLVMLLQFILLCFV